MKFKFSLHTLAIAAGVIFTLGCPPTTTFAQGTAFSYQGRLDAAGSPANGIYDLQFALFDAASGGTQQSGTWTQLTQGVTNGLFTVKLDFGNFFPGADRWLEIGVRTNGGGTFATLTPRQAVTPTPYAITANYAYAATTLTTASNQPLNFVINGNNVLRITSEYDSQFSSFTANSVGGSPANVISNGLIGGFIAGGGNGNYPNRVGANYASVLGGSGNTASGQNSTAMGYRTIASGSFSTAMGRETTAIGSDSTAMGNGSTASGSDSTAMGLGTAASGPTSTAMGGNTAANGSYSTAMGYGTIASNNYSTAMGLSTTASGPSSTAMGNGTTASGQVSTAMGKAATASGDFSTAMGYQTTASGQYSTAMGSGNIASGYSSTAMGFFNTASGNYSTTMGDGTAAGGNHSTAMGYRAKANHQGSFVWSDSQNADFASTANDQFLIRASGGVGIGTPNPQGSLHVYSTSNPTVVRIQNSGTPGFGRVEFVSNPQGDANEWRPGYIQSTDNGGFVGGLAFFVNGAGAANKFGSNEVMRVVNGAVGIGTTTPVSALQVVGTVTATTFSPSSDRNLKENFVPVSAREVLEKVATLPISRWNFKDDAATSHVGPMAQDFHAAFGLGTDERHIATVDADGVAFAAIQGLNQKLEETRAENADLKAQLAELKQLIQTRLPSH